MLSISEDAFHDFITSNITQSDAVIACVGYLGANADAVTVRELLNENGINSRTWNLSRALQKAAPLLAVKNGKFLLTPSGKKWLAEKNLINVTKSTDPAVKELRDLLPSVGNTETKEFLEECILCLEHGLKRAAVVMSWVAAVHVLKQHVFSLHRAAFDAEVRKVQPKWKSTKSLDDYSRLKESELLDRLAGISIIGKNTKSELLECLNRRNSCGHPNSFKIGGPTVAHHLDILMRNVFQVF